MEHARALHGTSELAPRPPRDGLLAKKQHVRALKRVLIAKAEVRRLQSLVGRRRITAR
jgi:hypothetical protein